VIAVAHTPSPTLEHIIAELKAKGYPQLVGEIQHEITKEWDAGSSPTMKNIRSATFKAEISKKVAEEIERGPSEDERPEYRSDLIRRVALALARPKIVVAEDAKKPPSNEDRDAISTFLEGGGKLRVEFDEGVFSARLGDWIADGLTLAEALTNLAKKLRNHKPDL
jgi:hypothetical protein